jgi:hypothetical protein
VSSTSVVCGVLLTVAQKPPYLPPSIAQWIGEFLEKLELAELVEKLPCIEPQRSITLFLWTYCGTDFIRRVSLDEYCCNMLVLPCVSALCGFVGWCQRFGKKICCLHLQGWSDRARNRRTYYRVWGRNNTNITLKAVPAWNLTVVLGNYAVPAG